MKPSPASRRPERFDRLLRYVPISVTAALALSCILGARRFTVEELLSYTPPSLPAAAAVLLCAYAVKSLSVVFPISLLYLASGVIFPLWLAWGVNLLGLWICITLPYWVGRISGRELAQSVIRTYPKAARVSEVVSILMGARGMEYRGYLAGSLLGLLPGMLIQTALGGYADRPASPLFWLLCLLMLLVSAASALAYAKKFRKREE